MSTELTYQMEPELRIGIPRSAHVKPQSWAELRTIVLITLGTALMIGWFAARVCVHVPVSCAQRERRAGSGCLGSASPMGAESDLAGIDRAGAAPAQMSDRQVLFSHELINNG